MFMLDLYKSPQRPVLKLQPSAAFDTQSEN